MNSGIATECKFVSTTDMRRTSQLLVELAPSLPRGSGVSGVSNFSNLRAPGSRIMEGNLSPISSYLFLPDFAIGGEANRIRTLSGSATWTGRSYYCSSFHRLPWHRMGSGFTNHPATPPPIQPVSLGGIGTITHTGRQETCPVVDPSGLRDGTEP